MNTYHEHICNTLKEIYILQKAIGANFGNIHSLGYNKLEKENIISTVLGTLPIINLLNKQMEELLKIYRDQLEEDK